MVLKTIELYIEKLNRLESVQKRFLDVKRDIKDINIILNKTENVNETAEIINIANEKALKYEKIKGYKTNLNGIKKRLLIKRLF